MVNNETEAQAKINPLAGLEFSIEGYEIKAKSSKASKFLGLYAAVKNMTVGQLYRVPESWGLDPEKTAKNNMANILHNLRKTETLKGYEFGGVIAMKAGIPAIAAKEATETDPAIEAVAEIPAEEIFLLKLTKKPPETAPIPANLQKDTPAADIPAEETEA